MDKRFEGINIGDEPDKKSTLGKAYDTFKEEMEGASSIGEQRESLEAFREALKASGQTAEEVEKTIKALLDPEPETAPIA